MKGRYNDQIIIMIIAGPRETRNPNLDSDIVVVATRTSSVIGFAAGYFLRCLHVRQPNKCSVSGSAYFVDFESIQIEKKELLCGMFF